MIILLLLILLSPVKSLTMLSFMPLQIFPHLQSLFLSKACFVTSSLELFAGYADEIVLEV